MTETPMAGQQCCPATRHSWTASSSGMDRSDSLRKSSAMQAVGSLPVCERKRERKRWLIPPKRVV